MKSRSHSIHIDFDHNKSLLQSIQITSKISICTSKFLPYLPISRQTDTSILPNYSHPLERISLYQKERRTHQSSIHSDQKEMKKSINFLQGQSQEMDFCTFSILVTDHWPDRMNRDQKTLRIGLKQAKRRQHSSGKAIKFGGPFFHSKS